MIKEQIWVVTDDTNTVPDTQRSYRENLKERAVKVSVNELEQKMSQFLKSVCQIFQQAEQQTIQYSRIHLDEIELSVEISSEGEIKLMGTGGKASSKGAIKLKFTRVEIKSQI